ncbi:MAG: AAA family ATPase [Lacipirellulaceae bacterium]
MSTVASKQVDWLWENRIAIGRISLVVGMPGAGKSFLTCDLAARVSRGSPWPDGTPCRQGSVVLISSEDDPADTIKPRLDAHGADVAQVHLLLGRQRSTGHEGDIAPFTLGDVNVLRRTLELLPDCRLVVVDPIGSYLGGKVDAHRENEVRAVLGPIAQLASEHGVAVVLVAHRRKGATAFADDSAMGSRAFTGIARSVWHVAADPGSRTRRLFVPGKNNLGPQRGGLAFSIDGAPARVAWESDPLDMTADEAFAYEGQRSDDGGPQLKAAKEFLRTTLADGPVASIEVERLASDAGIAERTLGRARQELRVKSSPRGFGGPRVLQLPDE